MSGRTSKLLARAAAALALRACSMSDDYNRLNRQAQVIVLQTTTQRIYNNLKAKWRGSDHETRGRMGRRMRHYVQQAHHRMREAASA